MSAGGGFEPQSFDPEIAARVLQLGSYEGTRTKNSLLTPGRLAIKNDASSKAVEARNTSHGLFLGFFLPEREEGPPCGTHGFSTLNGERALGGEARLRPLKEKNIHFLKPRGLPGSLTRNIDSKIGCRGGPTNPP